MALVDAGHIGTSGIKVANMASVTLTTTAVASSGNLVILAVSVDNHSASDGDEGAVTGITDSAGGNTWSKAGEYCNGSPGLQAGTTISLWYSVLTNTIASGGTIVAAFSNVTSRDAACIGGRKFTTTVGAVSLEGTLSTSESGASSFDVTTGGMEVIRFVGFSVELDQGAIGFGSSTGYTGCLGLVGCGGGGGADTKNMLRGLFKISSAANDAYATDGTYSTADTAGIIVAVKEAATTKSPPRFRPSTRFLRRK